MVEDLLFKMLFLKFLITWEHNENNVRRIDISNPHGLCRFRTEVTKKNLRKVSVSLGANSANVSHSEAEDLQHMDKFQGKNVEIRSSSLYC